MSRYKLVVQYDGTNYCGWQVQPNGTSVQQVLTDALTKIAVGSVKVTGSGRTDSGVHARGQVAHVDMTTSVPYDKIPFAVNIHLPSDISVLTAELVDEDFHARYSAKAKTYEYRLYVSKVKYPLLDRYATRIEQTPDIQKMQEVAKLFIGEHDFKAFMSVGSKVESTVRTIYELSIDSGEQIVFRIKGNGFLYNMVRIIVGTILEVGYGKKALDTVAQALQGGDRKLAGKTTPACGLTLYSVDYE